MSRLFKASVQENRQLTKNHFLLTLHPFGKTKTGKPGQFYMVSVDNGLDPLLKRPFSLFRTIGRDFQLLYKTVGKATNILRQKKSGDVLDITGPFGNGFSTTSQKQTPVLVGGGLGSVPLFALAEKIAEKKPLFFIGAKTKKELISIKELKEIGINPIISTDDGTRGKKGLVTDELQKFLKTRSSHLSDLRLYACGPKPMLRELALVSKKFHLTSYAALEEYMACGFGACLGCAVNTRDGFKRVCKEGPVFSIDEIIW